MHHIINHVFTQSEVKQIRQQLEHGQWITSRETADGDAMTVKNNQQLDDTSTLTQELRRQVLARLETLPQLISYALPKQIFPPKFNRYRAGQRYGIHVDKSVLTLNPPQTLRTDLSATLFLSNPDQYQGGELVVASPDGEQVFKLPAGSLVLYPSGYLHQVKPIIEGCRIASIFWLESLIRSAEQRHMLFELNQSIQKFTRVLGHGDSEVQKLLLHYHNLIRMWTESNSPNSLGDT